MKRLFIIIMACLFLLIASVFFIYKGVIFQRGNPLPYIIKMAALNNSNQYSKVFDDEDIYLSRNGNHETLKKHIENVYDVTFAEQLGSILLFESKDKSIIVSTQIYWRYYSVWELIITPNDYNNDITPPNEINTAIRYEMYELEGFVVAYPSHWTIEKGNQDDHVLFYETKPDPNLTGGSTYYTQLYCWVNPVDPDSRYPSTAQAWIDWNVNSMTGALLKNEIIKVSGVEAAKTSYARPDKPEFFHTEIYIYDNGKEYYFSFFCDTTNENDIEIINEMINSISMK